MRHSHCLNAAVIMTTSAIWDDLHPKLLEPQDRLELGVVLQETASCSNVLQSVTCDVCFDNAAGVKAQYAFLPVMAQADKSILAD